MESVLTSFSSTTRHRTSGTVPQGTSSNAGNISFCAVALDVILLRQKYRRNTTVFHIPYNTVKTRSYRYCGTSCSRYRYRADEYRNSFVPYRTMNTVQLMCALFGTVYGPYPRHSTLWPYHTGPRTDDRSPPW